MQHVYYFKNPLIEDYKRHASIDGRTTLCGSRINVKNGHWFPSQDERREGSLVEGAMSDCQRCCNIGNRLLRERFA